MSKDVSISEINAYIEQAYKDWNIPGGLAAVVKDGEFLFAEGYGSCEAGKPEQMSADTVFAIGSCTKAFTGTAMGILVDEGKVDWDDPVIKYLPDFAMYDPWVTQHVTIRDLLNHKLGIQRWNRLFFNNEEFDEDDFIHRIRYMQPVKDFRTRFHYGNEQFITAGKIIEVVSGMRYVDFLRQRIFEPLEMHSTYANLQEMLANHKGTIAHGHYNQDDSLLPSELRFFEPQTVGDYWEIGTNAAGSIWSTLTDIKNWIDLYLGKGVYKGKQILSPEVFEEITTPQFMIHPRDSEIADILEIGMDIEFQMYAFGWMIFDYKGRKLIVHGGNTVNGNTVIGFVPSENIGVITFINTYSGIIHVLLSFLLFDVLLGNWRDYSKEGLALANAWLEGIKPMIQAFEDSRKKDSAPSLPLEAYAGVYNSPLLGDLQIEYKDGSLLQHYGFEQEADLEHWEDDVFRLKFHKRYWAAEFIAFELDEKGQVCACTLRGLEGNEIQRLLKR